MPGSFSILFRDFCCNLTQMQMSTIAWIERCFFTFFVEPVGISSVLYGSISDRSCQNDSNSTPGSDHADLLLPKRLNEAIERKVRLGEISRAASLLTSPGLANGSDATFEKLQQKHPPASHPSMPCPPDLSPLQASAKHLEEVVKKSRGGSGPGADGWRFEHFRILQQDDRPASLLLQVCNLFLNGSIPTAAATAFASARLIALRKGKSDVRPIAVGNVFRRLVAKLACHLLKHRLRTFFSPLPIRSRYTWWGRTYATFRQSCSFAKFC